MGQDIDKTRFSDEDYVQFRHALNDNLKTFRSLLSQPGFGEGEQSYGSELELYILDQNAYPKPINERILQDAQDKQLTLELNQFNLEYNFLPLIKETSPFSKMAEQMHSALSFLDKVSAKHDSRVVPIGILPTLRKSDMGRDAITNVTRYHVLADALRSKRGEDFQIHIEGQDALEMTWSDVSPEGANTSFQFHYRVSPTEFAGSYNAAQLAAPLALALAANSPFFLGHRLWQETRIALFKQSIDYRLEDALDKHLPSRVLYGLGWVRKSIYELLAESVYLFEPILPILSGIDSGAQLRAGVTPDLNELRLHQGSVWSWNRPIYDPHDGGHLRIETRAFPAGPTPANMAAIAALMSGFMKGLLPIIDELIAGLPFRYAEQNFYRAAKYGLNAKLFWPNLKSGILEERPVTEIVQALLPLAREGLGRLGVDPAEIGTQLGIISDSLNAQMNGARWQRKVFQQLIEHTDEETALKELVELYYQQYQQGKPVHDWSLKI